MTPDDHRRTSGPVVKAPSALLALAELPRALLELGVLPFTAPILRGAPAGDGHAVLVLPGFVADDRSTGILRRYLRRTGYDARRWDLGRNLGPRAIGQDGERLVARVAAVRASAGGRVSLVGWSLGGIMARVVARRAPDLVRQVITLGSPFAGSPKATNVWRAYELLSGQRVDDPNALRQLCESAATPAVRSTAIYSRTDGAVAWRNCRASAGRMHENIAIHGSHLGLVVNPSVLYAVADRLAQSEDDWRPFHRNGIRALVYPRPGRD